MVAQTDEVARAGASRGAGARPGGKPGNIARGNVARGLVRPAVAAIGRQLARPLASYYLLLGSGGLLVVVGLVMVFSASWYYSYVQYHSYYYVITRQAIWLVIALVAGWLITRMSPGRLRMFGYPMLLIAIGLLAATFVPGVGTEVNGNRNWLDFGGPFRIQPSEIAKLALVIWGADIYARKRRLLGQWRHIVIPFFPGALAVCALVVGQRDLGTAVIIMGIVLTLLWAVGVPARLFLVTVGAAVAVATFFIALNPNRLSRVTQFHNVDKYASDGTFQVLHGFFALGTGSWWGTGLGGSRQKWGQLPEAHTDFIFAVIGEELGLAGTLAVLALFLTLGYGAVRVSMRSKDLFVRLAAAGIAGWLLLQTIINLGAVLGLLPVAGVPLPLISYGGSALLPTVAAVAMLVTFAKHEPGAREALAARRGPLRRSRS